MTKTDTIYIIFAENGEIRKWSHQPFEIDGTPATAWHPAPAAQQDETAAGIGGDTMTDKFRDALAVDPQGFIDIVEMGHQIWEPAELARWLETPQRRWDGLSPIDLITAERADDVLDVLEHFEVR